MEENKKPVEPIKATVKKPNLVHDLGRYAMEEVIMPKSKDMMNEFFNNMVSMFSDAATKTISKAIYKDEIPRKTANNPNKYTPTTKYNTTVYRNDSKPISKPSVNTSSSVDIEYIWVQTQEQANDIVTTLIENIDNYGKAKVADLYDKLRDENGNKIARPYTDNKFGWTEKEKSAIGYYKDRGQYFIDLPKPVNIENV